MKKTFDELFYEALKTPFSGWDFGFIENRIENESLPWDYKNC